MKPRFLIECYSDVRDSDIIKLEAIGHDAGIDIVDVERLSWPSPDWTKTPK